jgi:hypothetical protein
VLYSFHTINLCVVGDMRRHPRGLGRSDLVQYAVNLCARISNARVPAFRRIACRKYPFSVS